jgi:signal recognition particle subunit SRP54
MRAVTGQPIKLVGTGEKLDELEAFHPRRIAGRILGMGDVVSLVERAAETIDAEKAEKIAARMKKGSFDLEDLSEQLNQMKKLGGMSGVMGMLPGIGKLKKQIAGANIDEGMIGKQQAIISSMTPGERRNPKVLNASRKKRIAAGSGTSVQEINRLVKMHRQMADMMKRLGKRGGFGGLFGGGPSPEEMQAATPPGAQKGMGQFTPGGLPGGMTMPRGGLPGLPGLPGAGRGGLPGLPGFPTRKK